MDARTTMKTMPSQLNGSEISSQPGSSRQATLTIDPSRMCSPVTSPDTRNVISSPGLADGAMPCASQDGLTTDLFGLEVVHVSRSVSRANGRGSQMRATSGLSGENLSASDHLQRSLESRLRVHLNGSDLCEVIWKPWAAPWGQSLSRPRARVRIISEIDMGLWPTVRANKWGHPDSHGNTAMFQVSPWATPAARDYRSDRSRKSSAEIYGSKGRPLPRQALEATLNGVTGAASFPGSLAPTERLGGLNPEFVCWLMGLPQDWVGCAPSKIEFTRK